MAVTIKVEYKSLSTVVSDMEKLACSARARNLTVSLSESKGEYAREMELLGETLFLTGQAFSEIAKKTAVALNNANIEFRNADATSASQFNG